jgi:HSP20 family protein
LRTGTDRLFEKVFGGGGEGCWQAGTWALQVDLYDTDDAFVLKAELPGLGKDDIQIEVHDRTLTLPGKRKQEAEAKEERYHRRERTYGSFQHSSWLPTIANAEKIQADFKNGILERRLPKSETAQAEEDCHYVRGGGGGTITEGCTHPGSRWKVASTLTPAAAYELINLFPQPTRTQATVGYVPVLYPEGQSPAQAVPG